MSNEIEPPPPYSSLSASAPAAGPADIPYQQSDANQQSFNYPYHQPYPASQNYNYPYHTIYQNYPAQPPYPDQQPLYPNQQPQYPNQQSSYSTVVVVSSPPVFGPAPCQCFCPKCQEVIVTRAERNMSSMAWLICVALCISGCLFIIPWFLCWIPFCFDGLKDTVHRCPKCMTYLGTYQCANYYNYGQRNWWN